MTAWWLRNRWFLVALVALIPAAIVVSLVPRWFPYQDSQPRYDEVAVGETVRYSGADISLRETEVLDGERFDAPTGADIVVATFEMDVVESSGSALCTVQVVDIRDGLERRWDSEIGGAGDYRVPDRYEGRCDLNTVGAYDLQLVFLVPEGQITEPVIEFTSSTALPRALRLR